MGDPFRKVTAGQPLQVPAAAYNAFVDAALAARRDRGGAADALRGFRQAGVVPVLNDTAEPVGRFAVLVISAPVIPPVDSEDAFAERVALRGVAPTSAHAGRFCVLLAPADAGAIAPAVVDGATVCRVRVVDECDRYAVPDAPLSTRLKSAPSGQAHILWLEPEDDRTDPEIAWAVVRLGGGSPIALGVITAASETDPSPAAAVTYDGEAEGLAFSAQAPLLRPFDDLPVIEPATVGSPCLVLIDSDDECVATATLLLAAERLVHEECEEADAEAAFRVGDGLSSAADWAVGSNLRPAVGSDLHVAVTAAQGAERAVAVGSDGEVAFGVDGGVAIAEMFDPDLSVEAGYFNDVPAGSTLEVAVSSAVAPARSLDVAPPAGGLGGA